MSHNCIALQAQRNWRDLRHLEQAVPALRWVEPAEAADAAGPLVAGGLWACREPGAAGVLRQRMAAGRNSLLVARFEPVELGPLLGAPTAIRVVAGETTALVWEDGEPFQVPGVTVVETAIPGGHWARSTAGTTVFAYQPHTGAGLVVLCTATVAGVALGCDPVQQRALLGRLLAAMARRGAGAEVAAAADPAPGACTTAAAYLARHGGDGALVLLAALNAADGRVDDAALAAVGAALPAARLADLVGGLPAVGADEMVQALRAAGWGAHLRALGRRRREES